MDYPALSSSEVYKSERVNSQRPTMMDDSDAKQQEDSDEWSQQQKMQEDESSDMAATVRYEEAVQTITITEDATSALGPPLHCKSLNVVLVPGDGNLHVVPLPATPEKIKSVPVPTSGKTSRCVLLEPNLVVASCDKSHAIFALNHEREDHPPIKSFKWHLDTITDLDVVDGNQVVSGSADGQIYVCDVTNVDKSQFPDPVLSYNVGPHRVQSVSCHPSEKHLLSWTSNRGHLQLFDTRESPRVVGSVQVLPDHNINDHALYRNDAIVAFEDGLVQVIDLRTMTPFKSYRDQSLEKIRNFDIFEDSWCAFYGSGFRAVRLPPLLRKAPVVELCRVDVWEDDLWQGTHISEDTVVVTSK